MKKRFFSSTFLRTIFFLFLIIGISKNINAQCIIASNTDICYGDSTDLCVNINSITPSFSYLQDFEDSLDGLWIANGVTISNNQTFNYNNTNVLGSFANDDVTVGFTMPVVHDSILLEFDLYIHDSWDGVTQNETFSVEVDGVVVLVSSFQLDQAVFPPGNACTPSCPAGLTNITNIAGNLCATLPGGCSGPWFGGTGMFRFSKMIAHNSAGIQITFNGLGLVNGGASPLDTLPVINDESWSLDNVSIEAFNTSAIPTVTWTDITNNSFISSDPCITVSPTSTTDYQVVIDSSGTTLCVDSVTISVSPEINITATVNDNSSQGACDGQIFSSATGGFGLLIYDWDTSGFTYPGGQTILNLCENTYNLTVTDQNNCSADTSFNVEWNPCNLTVSIIDSIDCNGGTGAFQINVDTVTNPNPLPFFGQRFIYTVYTANPLTPFGFPQFSNLPSLITASNYPAGDYIISVFDKQWGDSCYANITLTEPDPIQIHTTVTNTTASWTNDGSILIDSITGGNGNFLITWYDSSYTQTPPGVSISVPGDSLLDSIYFSHEFYGGYSITVSDTLGCFEDTTLYVYPNNTITNFDTIYISQHETCWGFDDGKIFGSMSDSAVPPFTFIWQALNPVTFTWDTIRVDCFGCPPPSNYNPSHVATHTNLAPGCYSLTALDAFGNASAEFERCVNPADSMYVIINPDVDSVTLDCSESRILTAVANPLPAVAQLMPDTQLIVNSSGFNTFTMDFSSGSASGATYSLYDSPQRTYYLECTGTLTDTSNPPLNYDAAFMDWPGNPSPQNSIWSWNNAGGGTVPLLNSSAYDGVNHTYTWTFTANSNSANQNLSNPNIYDHEFAVNTTIISGNLSCQVFGIVDTIIYDYVWTTVANPGIILGTNDTLVTDSSVVVTTDYVVTVTNTNGCQAFDTIRVKKNLNTLASTFDIVPVRPCYGDLTGEIHIDVVDSTGVQPFTYILYDVDTNFIQSTSDTFFTGLASGDYVIQVQDTIGCLDPFTTVYIDQPDTIFACGVDELNDTTFDIFTHTVIANDPLTWNFQTGILAPNFQYYLVVDSTFGLTTTQQLPTTFDQDAAFQNYSTVVNNPNPGPWWTVDGDVLRPDIDLYNSNHTYIYHSPSDVNSTGPVLDYFTGSGNILNFEFFGLNSPFPADTADNQGGLRFRLHKIACTQTDTAFTCKGEGLGFAYVRPQSVNGSLGGIPYAGGYYETAWIQYNPQTGVNIDTIQGGLGAGPSDTIVGLFAGSYKVVVIDSLGCSEFVRYLEVVEPIDDFRTELDTVIPVLCKFDSTGVIQVSNFGGFDSVATNGSVIVPIASTTSRYAVLLKDTITSYNPCVDTVLVQAVFADTVITYHGVLDSIIFNGLSGGRYQVHVYDSIPDATYAQYDPLTGEVLTTPFNYMPCPQIVDAYIKEPCNALSSIASVVTNVLCWGDSTAVGSIQAAGGANETAGFGYTYQWHNAPFGPNGIGQIGAFADSLWADTILAICPTCPGLWHTVTVTDTSGCSIEDSVEVKHLNSKIRPFYVNTLNTPMDTTWGIQFIEDSVSCFDVCDGEVVLQSLGGVYPHEYVWDTEPLVTVLNQPDTMSGLCEGGHDVLITDGIGCDERVRFRIYTPDQIFAIGTLVDPISCFDEDDGNAHVTGIGGNNLSGSQNSYVFNWFIDSIVYNVDSLIGQGQNIGSLPPGIHVVSVTDYKGCTNTDTVEFIEPEKLSVLIVDSLTVYAFCEYTESAQLCAQAFGGTPNYTYQWNDLYGQYNSTGLPSGSSFCANNLTPINVNSIDGTYTVFVIDDRGCFADTTIDIDTITNTFNVNSIITTETHVSCFGGYDGAISIDYFNIIDSVVNGITYSHVINLPNTGYSFTWTGPNGYSQSIEDISTLYAGSYAVIVEDSMGCRRTKNIEILEPDQLYYGIYNTVNATCVGDEYTNPPTVPPSAGSCDGQIMVNVTGGTWPYYYDEDEANVFPISNQVQLINDTLIENLCFGLHEIYLTDAEGCEGQVLPGATGIANIGEGIVVTVPGVNLTPTTCSDTADGIASLQFPGADPLFNYTWETHNPGPPPGPSGIVVSTAAPTFAGLYQGDFWVVAHYADAASFNINYDGCDAAQSFTITGPTPIIAGELFIEPDCWADSNGIITLSPSGGTPGTPPYTYLWDNTASLPNGSTASSETALGAGTYAITITDGNNCDILILVDLTQPEQLQNDFTVTDVLCSGDNTGKIIRNTTGGTPTATPPYYNYNWGGINPTAVAAGTYPVIITDANGCSITDTAIVGEPNPLAIQLSSNNNYGVDASGIPYAVSCNGASDGEVLGIVTGGTGSGTYIYDWSNTQTGNPATNISSGNLTLDITDANGCTATESIFATEPTIILDNEILSTNDYGFEVSCYGANDGWISLNPSGGVIDPNGNGAYNYDWNPNVSSDSVASNLYVGNYSVTISDENNCDYTFYYTLQSPTEPFNANVSTVNYSGPTHTSFAVTFIDSTVSSSGSQIPVNHYWYWPNTTIPEISLNSGFESFTHTFSEIGLNDCYVIVENTTSGCNDTVSFTIAGQGIPEINNVFSPNGDGINDQFMFDEFGIDVISIEIYNRWGQLVNNWSDINKGWEGTASDGQELPEGAYFYVLTAEGQDGYYYSEKGTITLVR